MILDNISAFTEQGIVTKAQVRISSFSFEVWKNILLSQVTNQLSVKILFGLVPTFGISCVDCYFHSSLVGPASFEASYPVSSRCRLLKSIVSSLPEGDLLGFQCFTHVLPNPIVLCRASLGTKLEVSGASLGSRVPAHDLPTTPSPPRLESLIVQFNA